MLKTVLIIVEALHLLHTELKNNCWHQSRRTMGPDSAPTSGYKILQKGSYVFVFQAKLCLCVALFLSQWPQKSLQAFRVPRCFPISSSDPRRGGAGRSLSFCEVVPLDCWSEVSPRLHRPLLCRAHSACWQRQLLAPSDGCCGAVAMLYVCPGLFFFTRWGTMEMTSSERGSEALGCSFCIILFF